MSQEGATNLSQGTQDTHDLTFTIATNTPLGSTKMGYSDSSKSDENNISSKPTSPVVSSDVIEIKETWENVVIADEEGEGGGDGFASDASESKSKSSSDEVDCELLDLLAGASEGCSGGNNDDEVKSSADADHKMHALTERERRKEMNNKFDILHALIPNLPEKTDKATIVEATINYIKNLQDEIHKLEMLKAERERAINIADTATAVTVDTALQAPPSSEEEHESVAVAATREMTLADMVHVWEQEVAASGGSLGRGSPTAAPTPAAPPAASSLQTWTGPNMTASLTGNDAFITLSLPHQGGQNLVAGAVAVLERHHINVVTATVSTSEQCNSLISLHCHLSPESSSSQNLTPLDKYKLAMSELMLWSQHLHLPVHPMSQEGTDLSQDVDEIPDHTAVATTNNLVRSIKAEKSNSSSSSGKPVETNIGLKVASPTVFEFNTKIEGIGKNTGVKREEGGEGGGRVGVSSGVRTRGTNGKGKSAMDMEHALHIWTERERRKKMKNMFSTLHGLLPKIPGKADKATIVGEAIGYIKALEDVVQKLETIKMERVRAQQWAATAAAAAAAVAANNGGGEGSSHSQAPLHSTAAVAVAEPVLPAPPAVNAQPQKKAVAPPTLQTWSAPNITLTMAGVDAFINMCLPRQKASFTTVAFVLEKHQIDVVTSTISADQDKSLFSVHVRLNEASLQSPEGLTPEAKYKLAVSELMVLRSLSHLFWWPTTTGSIE
uniref:BHLH domain-containing protein n=1 Tax=Oryza punctata TaxID=4537 RepID=A0A0E0KQQ5_ORYPU